MQKVTKALLDKKSSLLAKSVFVAYSLFLGFVTLVPTSMFKSEKKGWLSKINIENGDKVVHAALFFIFVFLLYYSGWTQKKSNLIMIPFLVGILIEILQHSMGMGRTFDIWDIMANTIGIIIAYLLTLKLTSPN
jgi:glycopeptide antibiotics resistance protein